MEKTIYSAITAGAFRLMALPEVKKTTGMSTTFIYTSMAKGEFPGQIKIGKAARWNSLDIAAWLNARFGSPPTATQPEGSNPEHQPAPEFIRLPTVKKITGMSTTFIYTSMAKGEFPKQQRIRAGSAWITTDIVNWLLEKITQSAAQTTNQR